MTETIVQMMPMLVLAGLIAGWVAEAVSSASGYGFISDMVLGLAGSLLAGAFVWLVIWPDAGMTTMLLMGCVGATVAIFAQRGIWPSTRVAS
jgi:uncharacterized membrane protein YeaQ/YmgE (transglycosylase-associated protein family)